MGWLIGWLDGWTVGWIEGWLEGWRDGWPVGKGVGSGSVPLTAAIKDKTENVKTKTTVRTDIMIGCAFCSLPLIDIMDSNE